MTTPDQYAPPTWEQQPDETDRSYEYFKTYRDMGRRRNFEKTAAEHQKTTDWLYKLSSAHNWTERAKAWDIYQDEQWAKECLDERRKAAKKHVAIANDMLEMVAEKLSSLDLYDMKPADVSKWVDVAVKVTRAALGEPDNLAISGPGGGPIQTEDITALTPQQRRERLHELRTQINTRLHERDNDTHTG